MQLVPQCQHVAPGHADTREHMDGLSDPPGAADAGLGVGKLFKIPGNHI